MKITVEVPDEMAEILDLARAIATSQGHANVSTITTEEMVLVGLLFCAGYLRGVDPINDPMPMFKSDTTVRLKAVLDELRLKKPTEQIFSEARGFWGEVVKSMDVTEEAIKALHPKAIKP